MVKPHIEAKSPVMSVTWRPSEIKLVKFLYDWVIKSNKIRSVVEKLNCIAPKIKDLQKIYDEEIVKIQPCENVKVLYTFCNRTKKSLKL